MNPHPASRGILICVSGPSGVGKGTVIRRLRELEPGLLHSVSATTRPVRPGEIDGVSYHFVSRARFEEMIAADEVLSTTNTAAIITVPRRLLSKRRFREGSTL
jgi:guanylate kinase